MKILALDLGTRTGFACGEAGAKPHVEAWVLRKPSAGLEVGLRNLACTLRDRIILEDPDLIVAEHWLHPAASRNADATISQLHMHGVIEALAGVFGIRVERPAISTIRSHFCGATTAAPKRQQPRTARQREADREAINMLVVKRAILLGYLPHGSMDWDKASACAIWDWASATFARKTPRELHLFGEQP